MSKGTTKSTSGSGGQKPRRRGQKLGYVHLDEPRAADKPLTRDEARRIAVNMAKLPELLRRR